MTEVTGLIERLRQIRGTQFTAIENALVAEAADCIETLSTECEALRLSSLQLPGETISVAALLNWMKDCWPAGSGSDFNQGVVRGFEIIKAQLEAGHIQHQCAAPSPNDQSDGLSVGGGG